MKNESKAKDLNVKEENKSDWVGQDPLRYWWETSMKPHQNQSFKRAPLHQGLRGNTEHAHSLQNVAAAPETSNLEIWAQVSDLLQEQRDCKAQKSPHGSLNGNNVSCPIVSFWNQRRKAL